MIPSVTDTKRVIVALDNMTLQNAAYLAQGLADEVAGIKLGLEQLVVGGLDGVSRHFADMKAPIFIDGKSTDIARTLALTARKYHEVHLNAAINIRWVSVMASSGPGGLSAVVDELAQTNIETLAVTVLTTFTPEDCIGIYGAPPSVIVPQFARMVRRAGCQGIVCSPIDAQWAREDLELENMTIVCPGIRPAGTNTSDHAKWETPSYAISQGADYLVIGRPITEAPDPMASLEAINHEVSATLAKKRG